jgi:uncharacterized protein
MGALADLLSSRVKAEILRLLFGPGAGELHVREMARRARLNEATVRQELKRLDRLGVVTCRKDGNRLAYRAAASHPLHPELRGIVLKTCGLADVLREAIASPRVRVAFVFGSVAEGTESPDSDIDLMVIGDVTLRQLAGMLSGVASRLGREINPHVLSPKEFAARRRARDHFLATVRRGPKIFVVGDADELESVGR